MDFAAARAKLVAHLRQEIKDERVIEVMARVPREHFVPLEEQNFAYLDDALPTGFGQTKTEQPIIGYVTILPRTCFFASTTFGKSTST